METIVPHRSNDWVMELIWGLTMTFLVGLLQNDRFGMNLDMIKLLWFDAHEG